MTSIKHNLKTQTAKDGWYTSISPHIPQSIYNPMAAHSMPPHLCPEPGPPSYEQSQVPPPSYESLFGQMQDARSKSSSTMEFYHKVLVIINGTLACTVCIGILLLVPIAMVIMGALYLDDCPRERYIPIYLIVGGAFGIFKTLTSITQRVKNQRQHLQEQNGKTSPLDAVLNCFMVVWFVAGSVWTFQIYNDVTSYYDPNPAYLNHPIASNYCHWTLYWFSFWLTVSVYAMAPLATCCLICWAGILSVVTVPKGKPATQASGVADVEVTPTVAQQQPASG